jgi:hypothetical protein
MTACHRPGTRPRAKQSGKKKTVLARFIRDDRPTDAPHQAFCAPAPLRAGSAAPPGPRPATRWSPARKR